ncbi:hypothetical protein L873DRAFT_126717 [Choiromyces venosus 120613-1]|uniref:Uncharacterized protein n=1 Tax=Choiromyces venosus 120613-1 TaxID=1336337 RepID=A0A3N4J8Z8_9PEZI|nr:hypothetical protein L873DRAFT_126717 [Choiromyces venosus 120613-1]
MSTTLSLTYIMVNTIPNLNMKMMTSRKLEQLNEAVMDCWKAKIASENATRTNPETPVFDLTLLESKMSELLLTTNEMTKVLLSVLLVLRLVCRMIDGITRISDEIRFWKGERTEQVSIDQLSNELVKIDMEVVEISMGISESKPSDTARVRLSEGMVRSSRFFSSLREGSAVVLEDCFNDNKVGSRSDVFVAYAIDFLGAMKRAGIG